MSNEDFYREMEESLSPNPQEKNLMKDIPFEEYSAGVEETFEIARQLGVTEFSCRVKGLPKKIEFDVNYETDYRR